VLEHTLKNTGRKAITTSVYDHNFFMLDDQPTGPDFVVKFPFDLRATADLKGLGDPWQDAYRRITGHRGCPRSAFKKPTSWRLWMAPHESGTRAT